MCIAAKPQMRKGGSLFNKPVDAEAEWQDAKRHDQAVGA
jgi:hypothetical protein